MTNLLNAKLPKWPQMLVTGIPVTHEQAKEIIRRTDLFLEFPGGNSHEWVSYVGKRLSLPTSYAYERQEERRQWLEKWGYIRTHYVHNEWISSSYIEGPHGWCHPDGTIGYIDNVGKWPSAETLLADWKVLASAFPFLDIGVTFRDEHEKPEKELLRFVVRGGVATVVTLEQDVHAGHPHATRGNSLECLSAEDALRLHILDSSTEVGIPTSWIEDWAVLLENQKAGE